MSDLVRLSLSIEKPLYDQLERLVESGEVANRSEFVRGMIREKLVSEEWQGEGEALAMITLVYDHHKPHLQAALTDIQHDHHNVIISTLHVHLDHHNCLEVLVVRGKSPVIKKIADELLATKGVIHGKLTITTTGKEFEK